MKFLLLLAVSAIGCFNCLAQDPPRDAHVFVLPAGELWYQQVWIDSMYLFDHFETGKIQLITGVTPTNRPLLNYNIYLETVFIKQGNDEYIPVDAPTVKSVEIGDHKLIYVPEHGYLEVILSGKISVAERTRVRMNSVYSITRKNSTIAPDSRSRASDYKRYIWIEKDYFMFEDEDHVHYASAAPLYKKFPGKKSQIKSFMKGKTDFKKRGDVVELVSYCNKEL